METTELGRRTMLGLVAGGAAMIATRADAKEASLPSHPAEYTLPPLPYATNALDGFLSAEILQLHHDKHHAGYVKGLNKALAELEQARAAGKFDHIKELSRTVAFNGSGHVLHSIYWTSMSPSGGGQPKGLLQKHIDMCFGSFDGFKKQFAAATKAAEASAWGALAYDPLGQRLLVLAFESHENMGFQGVVPLLVCDVWEHAYYLRYKNDRAAYVDKFFDVIDWDSAEARLTAATKS